LAVIVALTPSLDGTRLWLNYNYAKFYETRLAYARQHQRADQTCAPAPVVSGDFEFSAAFGKPEQYPTKNGTYVFYRSLEGGGFLYATKLGVDPIADIPELYLAASQVWDDEACVYLVGFR